MTALDTARIGRVFARAIADFGSGEPLILTHNDADGLSSAALLARALAGIGRAPGIRVLGRGENPWSADMAAELAAQSPAGLVVADLGLRAGAVQAGTPTVVIDHHVSTGDAGGATVLREAVSLLNAPRRAGRGDAGPALALLMKADGPNAVISGEHLVPRCWLPPGTR